MKKRHYVNSSYKGDMVSHKDQELCLFCGEYECNCLNNVGFHVDKLPNLEEQELIAYNKLKKYFGASWSFERGICEIRNMSGSYNFRL